MGSVFISYRRDDSHDIAHRLFADLKRETSENIFLDEGGGLLPGEDFVDRLGEEIARADVVLVVIGKQWLESRDARGRPRLADARDVLRREIVRALSKERQIIPVLVDDAGMPREEDLPEPIRPLVRRHAHRLSQERWDRDVAKLVGRIETLVQHADQELEAMLHEMDAHGLHVVSLYPEAAGDRFRDMPIIGKWRIDIRSSTGFHPGLGPAGRTTLNVTLRDDDTFVGEQLVHRAGLANLLGPQRRRLTGRWSLGIWNGGGLLIRLDAVIDGAHEFQFRLPAAQKMGDGYFARAEDGLAYTLHSLGGRALRRDGL